MTHKSFSPQPIDLKNKIGLEIRRLRRAKGIKRAKDFAKLVGIAKDQISRYETGKEEPRRENLKKISDFLGVSVDYFYNLDRIEPSVRDGKDEYEVDSLKRELLAGFREILASDQRDIIIALAGNIKAFLGTIRTAKEKRRYHRFTLNIPVEVKILDEPGIHTGIVINASQVGLLIESVHNLSIGKEVNLKIIFQKDTGPENFRAKGQIMWKNKKGMDDAEEYQYGVKLIEVLNGGLYKLESLFQG